MVEWINDAHPLKNKEKSKINSKNKIIRRQEKKWSKNAGKHLGADCFQTKYSDMKLNEYNSGKKARKNEIWKTYNELLSVDKCLLPANVVWDWQ